MTTSIIYKIKIIFGGNEKLVWISIGIKVWDALGGLKTTEDAYCCILQLAYNKNQKFNEMPSLGLVQQRRS